MKNDIKKIQLTDFQKRIILKIYRNGRIIKQDREGILKSIEEKIKEFIPDYNRETIETIYNDCETYGIVYDLFSVYTYKDYSKMEYETKSRLYSFGKDYIIEQYSSLSLNELKERGIIDNITNRFINETKDADDNEKNENFINFINFLRTSTKTRLNSKSDIPTSVIIKFLSKNSRFEKYARKYIEYIFKNYDIKNLQNNRNLLVSDDEVDKLIKDESFAQTIAQGYIYDNDGNKKIENSLVEDKLLSIYLRLHQYDIFELTAKEVMHYDEETGRIKPGQERTASKYIKYLSFYKENNEEAVNFIVQNKDIFCSDLVIMSQWYRIYAAMRKKRGVLEIANAIASNIDEEGNIHNINMDNINSMNLDFINKILYNLEISLQQSIQFNTSEDSDLNRERKVLQKKLSILANKINKKLYYRKYGKKTRNNFSR